jgi:hypothetical protein
VYVEERYWLLEAEETETFIKMYGQKRLSKNNNYKSEKNPNKSEINALKKSKEKKIDDDDRGSAFSDFLEDFTDTFFTPNRIQKENLELMFDNHGAMDMFEALEETGKRNVKDPIAYMQKVLRTLELGEMNQ